MTATEPPPRTSPRRVGFRLTTEGQLWVGFTVTLALIGWYKSINIILLLAFLMFGLFLVNVALARLNAGRVRASRVSLAPTFADEPSPACVTVTDRGLQAGTVEIVDDAGEFRLRWFVHGALSGTSTTLRQMRVLPGRGRYPFKPLVVMSGSPFGFVEYGVAMPADAGLGVQVLPARGRIDLPGFRRWLMAHGGDGGRQRRPLRRISSDQADVRGVRPFRHGDSLRWIHWRTTARRGEPMVREYDVPPTPAVLLVLDPWLPANPGPSERQALETALSLAATLAFATCSEDDGRITLVLPGRDGATSTSVRDAVTLRDALAPLAALTGDADSPLPRLSEANVRAAARLVVSTRPRSPLADVLSRTHGRAFLTIDATNPPPWFRPPRHAPA